MSPRRAKVLSEHGTADSPGALRRHLIAVTQHLVAAHGLTGLTTRKIAREAQVADGVLYNHFADKNDLVAAALAERAAALVADFLAARPEPGTATLDENLAVLARATLTFNEGIVPLVTGLLGHPALLHGFFGGIHAGQSGPQTAYTSVIEYVRAEQRLGRASGDVDAGAIAELLFGACQLRAIMALTAPQADGSDVGAAGTAEAYAVVAVLVRALRPTPS